MNYRKMMPSDIAAVVALYMAYYNREEGGQWTEATTTKRIRQVFTREDSFCMVLEKEGAIIAFAMGYYEQFDDGFVYNLVEIVVAAEWQGKGIGTAFVRELESCVKQAGAIVMLLSAVNDEMHTHFYDKLGFQNATNLVIKTKTLQ